MDIFSNEQLSRLVTETLPPPDGEHNLVVVGAVDQNGVKVIANFTSKNNDHWKLQAAYEHDWTGNDSIGAKVLFQM